MPPFPAALPPSHPFTPPVQSETHTQLVTVNIQNIHTLRRLNSGLLRALIHPHDSLKPRSPLYSPQFTTHYHAPGIHLASLSTRIHPPSESPYCPHTTPSPSCVPPSPSPKYSPNTPDITPFSARRDTNRDSRFATLDVARGRFPDVPPHSTCLNPERSTA